MRILNNKLLLSLILLLIIPILPLVREGFYFMQDDLQAFRVHQMSRCLEDFQIPCRWIPDMGYQYGYPQFNYYPPSVYYLGSMMHLLGVQFIDTVKILFILGFILSGVSMFIFLKAFLNKSWPAYVGAMLYSIVPYKAVEVYLRGALSEFWSFVFFPLIFWSSLMLIRKGSLKYIIWFSLSIGGLLLTHNLMSLIFLPIAGVWIILNLLLEKKWLNFPKIVLAGILGVGLAAFFTLPVIFEARYAHLETLQGGYFDYRQHFVPIYRLFVSNHFGYGSSGFNQDNDLSLSTGQLQWMVGLLGFVFAIIFFRKHKKIATITIALSLVELLVLFLIHQKSSFIWEKIPILWYLQFPWRFLSDSIFLLAILGAVAVYLISSLHKKWSIVLGVIIIASVFILHIGFFQPKEWYGISDADKFSGPFWEKQLTISIFDYLPIYAKFPPNKKAPELPEILDGRAEIIDYKKGSNYQIGNIRVDEEATVRVPLFDFPGMRVLADGQKIDHWHDDCRGQEYCLGLITFNLPVGMHEIEAKLQDTPIRKTGNTVTVVSFFILAYLVYRMKKNEKLV